MQLVNCSVPHGIKVGWVDQPDQRGTIDIIWSCLTLIVSSVWTVLHINVPAEDEGYWAIIARKSRWAAYVLIAPEMLIVHAAQCWQSARRSARRMRKINVDHWTIVHAFYADAGGFLLCAPDIPPFPVNSRALYYLVDKQYIQAPTISRKEIEDKGKADAFLKVVTCVQGAYMIVQAIARHIQHLEISCLELSTTALAFCMAATFFFWMEKPQSVETPVRITMDVTIAQVLLDAGSAAAKPYVDTPMDFVEQPGWTVWNRRPMFTHWGLMRRPIDRIPNDYSEEPQGLVIPICLLFIVGGYSVIHLLAWNFAFPTTVDLWLWRSSSLASFLVAFLWGIVSIMTLQPWWDFDTTMAGLWVKKAEHRTFARVWSLDVASTINSVVYLGARLVLIGEMLASMRLMDSSAYDTVNWTKFWPHV